MIAALPELEQRRQEWARALSKQKHRILVCAGTGCIANNSLEVYEEIRRSLEERGALDRVSVELREEGEHSGVAVVSTGCRGFCSRGPLVQVDPAGTLYVKVSPADAPEVVDAVLGGSVVDRLLYRDADGRSYASHHDIPFYRSQQRLVLENCGLMDPESVGEYVAHGGYAALAKALAEMTPEQVCQVVEDSGLRGRGGAGFPAGRKWHLARLQPGPQKYVVCNGDEGDPGAFMDRSLMEGDPHRVLEGLCLAGYATGASEGYIYVRAEYPLAVRRLRKAIADAEAEGLLGDNVLGSGWRFHVHIKEGAGAFVCGEETALLASIEGKRGMPRPKPPFPAESGLWGCPTTINNVETLGNVPPIVLRGADWYRQYGNERSPGTKTFAVTGKVANTGLVEVPMGASLREVIFDIGGGIPGGREFKAVQIGGPSGGCLTQDHLDLALDFDSLTSAGAIVGSGGLVVLDDSTCIVEVARFFMQFTQNESCGKCVPCREGTKRLLELLDTILQGQATLDDLDLLEELALTVKESSLCGLGKTAANPVLTTLRYFRHEYVSHIQDHRCPAGACKAFRIYRIDPSLCRGCSKCARVCPSHAISGQVKQPYVIDETSCTRCGACAAACTFSAIKEQAR